MIATLWTLVRRSLLLHRIALVVAWLAVLLWAIYSAAKNGVVTEEENLRIRGRFEKLLRQALGPAVTWPAPAPLPVATPPPSIITTSNNWPHPVRADAGIPTLEGDITSDEFWAALAVLRITADAQVTAYLGVNLLVWLTSGKTRRQALETIRERR